MLMNLAATVGALFALILGWVGVQALARRTAAQHPEAGPYREAGGGCGGGCCGTPAEQEAAPGCSGGSCGPCDKDCRHG